MHLFTASVFLLLSLPCSGNAQSYNQRQDSLNALTEEFQSLSRIFNTLNAGDTVYTPFFPMWSVQDRGMKLRIFSAFRNHGITFQPDEQIHIIVTPDQQDIADIRVGTASFGKMYAKFVLSRELHQAILARKYELKTEVPLGYGTE
jgi:hypothetical protein